MKEPARGNSFPLSSEDVRRGVEQLWASISQVWARSWLPWASYIDLVLALLLLRFLDQSSTWGPRLPPAARFSTLLDVAGSEQLGSALNDAMRAVECEREDLHGALPSTYGVLAPADLSLLVQAFSRLGPHLGEDIFALACDELLARFADGERTPGSEFFTPAAIKRLIAEILAPFNGRVFDPACGSGGGFVECARAPGFAQQPGALVFYGREKVSATTRLCKVTLALHGLVGAVEEANSYYRSDQLAWGRFDAVVTDPFFNARGVDRERIKANPRYCFGVPRADNANTLWLQLCYSSILASGRAGIVMPNSASDARGSEQQLRRRLLLHCALDVVVAAPSHLFSTSSLPCMLWFLDQGKRSSPRRRQVLFIDARNIYRQVSRTRRTFTPEQIEFLANVVRLYRRETPVEVEGSGARLQEVFPHGMYADVPGLCREVSLADIEAQGWSFHPGRYVGVTRDPGEGDDFRAQFLELHQHFQELCREGRELEERISINISHLLDN